MTLNAHQVWLLVKFGWRNLFGDGTPEQNLAVNTFDSQCREALYHTGMYNESSKASLRDEEWHAEFNVDMPKKMWKTLYKALVNDMKLISRLDANAQKAWQEFYQLVSEIKKEAEGERLEAANAAVGSKVIP